MNIKGEKIILRAIEPEDSQIFLEMINDDQTEYMLGGWSFPVSKSDQENWIKNLREDNQTLRCTIEYQNEPIGMIALKNIDYKNGNAEIHIKIALGNSRGKGFGTDAVSTLVRYSFDELRLKCIYARICQHNTVSLHIFKKCGFIEEGILRNRLFKKGNYINIISLSKSNTEI